MGLFKGGFLRLLQSALYALIFCCAAIILGFYSYFLSVLADRNRHIPTWEKAVEGISGAAVLYLIFATILTCCLGGVTIFALLAIILDVLFIGGMIAIAILTRHGASSCSGYVNTPLGSGQASSQASGYGGNFGFDSNDNTVFQVSNRTACRYNTVCFAVSIIAAFLFLITAAMQLALIRNHKKEKRYGPSPKNNYTSGYGKRKFWQRKPKNTTSTATRDAELGAGGLAAPTAAHEMRPSYETGTTMGNNNHLAHEKVEQPLNGTHHTGQPLTGTHHSGYHTQPQGTGVNPYGYTTNTTTTTGTATNY